MTTDAKRIGSYYFVYGVVSAIIGSVLSMIIRIKLIKVYDMNDQIYNVVVTSHGLVMIFLVVMPGLIGYLGNYIVPMMIGGPDMAKQKDTWGGGMSQIEASIVRLTKTAQRAILTEPKGVDTGKYSEGRIEKLNSYLAGLFESDGQIWLPKENMKKKHNPRFCISFNRKDEPLAKKLLEIIGKGHIRYKLKNNACVLIVSPIKGLKKIIEYINGELRTPKIVQLYNLIEFLNKNHSGNITKLPLKKENLANDSWLAGFIDGDGSFSIQHKEQSWQSASTKCNTLTEIQGKDGLHMGVRSEGVALRVRGGMSKNGEKLRMQGEKSKNEWLGKKRKISCRLRIEQRMYEPVTKESYHQVLTEISRFVGCNLLTRKQKSTGNEYYTLTASNRKSLSIILTYFNKYSLYSSKYLDYKDWEKGARLMLDNKHYTEEGIKEIDSLKAKMNLKRTYFNWDHLKNLN